MMSRDSSAGRPDLQGALHTLEGVCTHDLLHQARSSKYRPDYDTYDVTDLDSYLRRLDKMAHVPNDTPETVQFEACAQAVVDATRHNASLSHIHFRPLRPMGSFPAGAKVGDIDEFDYLCVVDAARERCQFSVVTSGDTWLWDQGYVTCDFQTTDAFAALQHVHGADARLPVYVSHVYTHGPATCMEISWRCGHGHEHCVSVDFTFAMEMDTDLSEWMENWRNREYDDNVLTRLRRPWSHGLGHPWREPLSTHLRGEKVMLVHERNPEYGQIWRFSACAFDSALHKYINAVTGGSALSVLRLVKVLLMFSLHVMSRDDDVTKDGALRPNYHTSGYISSHVVKTLVYDLCGSHDSHSMSLGEMFIAVLRRLVKPPISVGKEQFMWPDVSDVILRRGVGRYMTCGDKEYKDVTKYLKSVIRHVHKESYNYLHTSDEHYLLSADAYYLQDRDTELPPHSATTQVGMGTSLPDGVHININGVYHKLSVSDSSDDHALCDRQEVLTLGGDWGSEPWQNHPLVTWCRHFRYKTIAGNLGGDLSGVARCELRARLLLYRGRLADSQFLLSRESSDVIAECRSHCLPDNDLETWTEHYLPQFRIEAHRKGICAPPEAQVAHLSAALQWTQPPVFYTYHIWRDMIWDKLSDIGGDWSRVKAWLASDATMPTDPFDSHTRFAKSKRWLVFVILRALCCARGHMTFGQVEGQRLGSGLLRLSPAQVSATATAVLLVTVLFFIAGIRLYTDTEYWRKFWRS